MADTARSPRRPQSPAGGAPPRGAVTPVVRLSESSTVVGLTRRLLTTASRQGAGRDRSASRGPRAARPARLPEGNRLDQLVEGRVDEYRRQGRAGRHAVEAAEGSLTYDALDGAANRLARFLRRRRVGAGDRVAVLLARPTDALTAQLALTKVGAVWVPLDAGLPDRSLAAVLAGSGAGLVITTAAAASRLAASDVDAIYLDRVAARVDAEDARRPTGAERGADAEAPAYVVVHADASTHGAALGLRAPAVGHPAVTNLVRVAAAILDIGETDRVHHDPHTGSDLAVLETWLPWVCGATVVTPPAGADLRGPALGRFLADRGITVLRADPARLAGIDVDLPRLRLL
ncbi:uncharacterized protein LOC110428976, partial [Herrania umbratica]|uniref:Uncharacterized protein LOC110428976 n=1 Tax=Herrania umbratica TaxID=108875 RepID=A0A6J1BMM9_9ROSI